MIIRHVIVHRQNTLTHNANSINSCYSYFLGGIATAQLGVCMIVALE